MPTLPPDARGDADSSPAAQPAKALLRDRIEAMREDADDALTVFVDWAAERKIALYDHQEEAILELAAGHHVILATPTGSGKSMVALALHVFGLAAHERTVYTSPIKALVSEKFFALCEELGPDNVGLMTGDGTVNREAKVICCTAEVLAQIALQEGADADVQQVVMDEFHYYADRDRGMAWQIPLLTLTKARFLLMSATLGDTQRIEADLRARTGREVVVVSSRHRPVPLQFDWRETPLQDTVQDLAKDGRAPLYLVHGSQRGATEQAQALMSVDIASKEQKRALIDAMHGQRFDSPFGKVLQRFLKHGIGLHHAGLLPKYRLLVEKLAQQGLLKVICGTDTLGVGVNIPLRTVVFTKLCRYDGETTRLYSSREFHQIAGRAGRKGFDDQGWVVAQAPEHVIANNRMAAKLGRDGKPVKFVRSKPPERGYVPWTEESFRRLEAAPAEPLQSVFRIEAGMVMAMAKRPGGLRELVRLIGLSHDRPAQQLQHRRDFAQHVRALCAGGVLLRRRRDDARGSELVPAEGLQRDFSLHHTLSLFLVEALDKLQAQHRDEGQPPEAFAYDAVSLVEAILENPMPVLIRQQSAEKTRVISDLKAQGVPYDERLEILEEVTWPKPLAEWTYATFNDFARRHPWITDGAVRPKSIAREMAERWCTFDEYVRDLDLAPVEGVLLRHLGQAYRTLVQNVPDDLKTDELLAIIGFLRATIARVDASLLQEWERLRGNEGPDVHALSLPELPPRPAAPALDHRARESAQRAMALQWLKLACDGDLDAAAAMVESQPAWTAETVATLLEAWQADNGALIWEHRLRMRGNASVRQVGELWEVSVGIVGQDGDGTCTVQLEGADRIVGVEFI